MEYSKEVIEKAELYIKFWVNSYFKYGYRKKGITVFKLVMIRAKLMKETKRGLRVIKNNLNFYNTGKELKIIQIRAINYILENRKFTMDIVENRIDIAWSKYNIEVREELKTRNLKKIQKIIEKQK